MAKRDEKGFSERLFEIADELKKLTQVGSGDGDEAAKNYGKAAAILEAAADQVGRVLFADWS